MNQFELSPIKKLISRLYFYLAVFATFWAIGNLTPSSSEARAQKDLEMGVAKAYIGVPIEDVPFTTPTKRNQ